MNPITFTFNGLTLSSVNGYLVQSVDGIDGNDIRISASDSANNDGGFINARRYGMRIIKISGLVVGDSISDFFTKRNALLNSITRMTDGDLVITLWNGSSKSIPAKVTQTPQYQDREGNVTQTPFEIEFTCEDPFFYDAAETVYTLSAFVPGGMPVPSPVPAPVGGYNSPTSVINNGNQSVKIRMEINGFIVNPAVTNATSSEGFMLTTTINGGNTVSLEPSKAGLKVANGANNLFSSLSGTFPLFRPGANAVTFNGSSFDVNASLKIYFRAKYDYI